MKHVESMLDMKIKDNTPTQMPADPSCVLCVAVLERV
jgi:hypothetical protein